LYEEHTRSIIGAFYEVYNVLGYGLLESAYAAALDEELGARGHHVEREVWVEVHYKGKAVSRQRIDRIVDDRVVLEIKATEVLPRFAKRQLVSYLKVSGNEVGLILHFGPKPEFYRLVSTKSFQRHQQQHKRGGHADEKRNESATAENR
jgi:GxxExxY protein